MIMSKDCMDRTVLSMAAKSGKKDTFQALQAALDDELNEQEVTRCLCAIKVIPFLLSPRVLDLAISTR